MPYVNVQLTKGVPREKKATIVAGITRLLEQELGKKPEHTHIVIQEIDEENWGFAGQLTDDWRKSKESS